MVRILSFDVRKGGEKVKKTNYALIVALLFVTVLSGIVVYNTTAKYRTAITQNGTVTVAKWNFAGDNDNQTHTYNINIANTAHTSTLVGGKIAPGTSGSFNIALSNTSEVGVNVTVAIGTVTASNSGVVPAGFKFYSDSEFSHEITPGSYSLTGKMAAKTGENAETLPTKTIYWRWQYETGNVTSGVAEGDSADTTAGEAGSTLTIPVTITGTQVEPGSNTVTTGWY